MMTEARRQEFEQDFRHDAEHLGEQSKYFIGAYHRACDYVRKYSLKDSEVEDELFSPARNLRMAVAMARLSWRYALMVEEVMAYRTEAQ